MYYIWSLWLKKSANQYFCVFQLRKIVTKKYENLKIWKFTFFRKKENIQRRKISQIHKIVNFSNLNRWFFEFSDFSVFFTLFQSLQLQTHLSPSSRGVGWANGHCDILITTHTQHVASFWHSRRHENIISRVPEKIRTFFYLFSTSEPPTSWIRCTAIWCTADYHLIRDIILIILKALGQRSPQSFQIGFFWSSGMG